MIILIKILVILMIMMTKITEKRTNIWVKYYLFRDYYLVEKKDQGARIGGWGGLGNSGNARIKTFIFY